MIQARKISTTTYPIVFFMADSSDHVTAKTGLSPTVTISKNGGAFGAASGAVAEIANGFYSFAGNATDRNTLGTMAIKAAATGADTTPMVVQIVGYDPFAIVSDVWDEELTGATHNVATSAGKRLRTIDSNVILSDVLPDQTGVAGNAIKFDGGASTTDGAYDPAMITILDGAGAGQTRLIYQYVGSTKTAYVDRDWKVQPTTGATYAIIADAGREHVNEGLAQAGGAATITLNAQASSDDDSYVGQIVFLKGGTGADQASHVIAYNGTTKVATVNKNWDVAPDGTTTYAMLPTGMMYLAGLVTDVWANATRSLTDKADFTLTSDYDTAKDDVLTPLATVDTVVDAIKAKTDNLPASPAAVGSQMALNSTAVDNLTSEVWAEATRALTDKVDFALTSTYDAAKTAASSTSVATVISNLAVVDGNVDDIEAYLSTNLDMAISDIVTTVAVSSTEAASVATGVMDMTVFYTLEQTVNSTSDRDLSSATKLWFAVKDIGDTDANSLVFLEKTGGLTVVNKTTYATTSHGSLVLTGSAGDWDIAVMVGEQATALLTSFDNRYFEASLKALVDGDAIHVWDGQCRITNGVIRTIA